MAKRYIPGKGWLDEEEAKRLEEESAGRLSDLIPVPGEDANATALRAMGQAPAETKWSVKKTYNGVADPVDDTQDTRELRDLVGQYNNAGYNKYQLSGGQLVQDGEVMMNATPQDIDRFKEYQRAQLQLGAAESNQMTRNGPRKAPVIMEGTAPARAAQMIDLASTPAYKNAIAMAALKGKDLSSFDSELTKGRARNAAAAEAAKIPGTPEYKREQDLADKRAKVQKSAEATRAYADTNATALEKSLADILGVTPDKLPELLGNDTSKAQGIVSNAVGNIDTRYPEWMKFSGTRNVASAIDNLKSKAQMFGLSKLRQSGVAPGSITEKEWPKFESMLANIDPTLSEDQFVNQLKSVYQQIRSGRDAGALDYSQLTEDSGPKMGDVIDGYLYLGGDPSSPASWKIAQ